MTRSRTTTRRKTTTQPASRPRTASTSGKRAAGTRTAAGRAKPAANRRRSRRQGRFWALVSGDRPYALALLALLVLIVMMMTGPVQRLTDATGRVDALTETRDRLASEVDRLQERKERLENPDEVELLARQELGLVKPGEIPFVVVTPEGEFARPGPDRGADPAFVGPWWRRLRDAWAEFLAGS